MGRAWDRWEDIQWEKARENSTSLKYYPKRAKIGRAWNVDATENGKSFPRMKLGDIGKWGKEGKECVVCGSSVSNIIFHVIVECQESKNSDKSLQNRGQEILTKKGIIVQLQDWVFSWNHVL